jgi:hypothetical protein
MSFTIFTEINIHQIYHENVGRINTQKTFKQEAPVITSRPGYEPFMDEMTSVVVSLSFPTVSSDVRSPETYMYLFSFLCSTCAS